MLIGMVDRIVPPDPRPKMRGSADDGELDRATLARCVAKDPLAFRLFVARYERTVFAVLGRILGRREVEDLAQETFLRAYKAFPRFDLDHPSRPSTWIVTIATRLALNERSRLRESTTLDEQPEPADAVNPETLLVHGQLGEAIAAAAASLPDDQRAAFVLAELHGLTTAEIANALGVPENTAKTRLFRAREKLRALLAAWIEPERGEKG